MVQTPAQSKAGFEVEQVAKGHALSNSEYLWGERLHSLSGQYVTASDHLHGEIFFPNIQIDFAVCVILSLCTSEKSENVNVK